MEPDKKVNYDEEKTKDPQLEKSTDSLPQVVLGDFGLAFEAHNDPVGWLYRKQNPGLPEPETLKDKADFGVNLKQLKLGSLIRMRESGDWRFALNVTDQRNWERFAAQ
ncbi:hypothetical protein MMYC01_205205 [Madurella mycetomatis]|uniref:Uncharacterized protein n=1 Tax=Madurella mycetomatis TaxID=100816 RepID=A0A175W795_9PEZI|nr:hypothetical protein MMYC01_205205 [Madurella mycetomatis]